MSEAMSGGERRHSIWRFSLRELLLLMLAVGAFFGWGVLHSQQYRRFAPTPFFSDATWQRGASTWKSEITEICQELGEPTPEQEACTITTNEGSTAARRTMYARFPLSSVNRRGFIEAFEKRVRDKLAAAGCKAGGGANGHGVNETRTLIYQQGPIGGVFEICLADGPDGKAYLIVTLYEMRGRFHSAGVSIAGNR